MDMSNTRRRQIKHWVENDIHRPWRKWLCYTQRAGATKSIKRSINRRERREWKNETVWSD